MSPNEDMAIKQYWIRNTRINKNGDFTMSDEAYRKIIELHVRNEEIRHEGNPLQFIKSIGKRMRNR